MERERVLPGASAEAFAATAPSAPEGERKQVTVLFADVEGSMVLAERLDPDQLTQIMTGLVGVCREAVERFGGTLDKFTGDGVMALFGAPLAQEDHARRACHAALALLDGARTYALTLRQRDIDLAVRVGLNSGEVVASSVGGSGYTAVGQTVGLAQRMESLAEPGHVRVSEHTAALLGDEFGLADLGAVVVKGVSTPVGTFALQAPRGGSAAAGRRPSGSARLVGRDDELAALHVALAGAEAGAAQVIGLVGEAGAGKSRLCDELARHARDLGVTVRRTAGVSHAQAVPLLPILALFRDYFGVEDGDTPVDVRAKVADRLLGLDRDLEPDLALVFDFLEVPDPDRPAPMLGPEARRRRILEVFRRVTSRRSQRQTLLLILEDLHWFDPHSAAFLQSWLPSFPGTRTLVVTNFRPEFHAPWSAHSYYRQIPLAPLPDSAVQALLDELLGPHPSLGELTRTLGTRAGGNPFFVEEIVRGLAADGTLIGSPAAYQLTRLATEVRVPVTVQAVLSERIDRLAAGDKSTLQAAAVIGRTFTTAVLGPVAGLDEEALAAALQSLCVRELLQGNAFDGEYRFWHPLTQEVAYGSLLAAQRRRLHRGVADALIALGPDRQNELAGLLATHFEAAGDNLEAARWQIRAGGRATNSDYAEARRCLNAALVSLATLPTSDDALTLGVRARTQLLRVGSRLGLDDDTAGRLSTEARCAAEELGDPALLAAVSFARGALLFVGGDHGRATDLFREGGEATETAGELGGTAYSRLCRALIAIYTGPLTAGLQLADDALALCAGDTGVGRTEIGYNVHDAAHLAGATLLLAAGPLDEARDAAEAVVARYRLRPMAEWCSWMLATQAMLADLTGEPADAQQARFVIDEALALGRDSGSWFAYTRVRQGAGVVALLAGRPAEAALTFAEALSDARSHRSGLQEEAGLLAYLARARLALAEGAAARGAADEAVAVARCQGAKVAECFAHAVRATVFRETATGDGDLTEARAAVNAAAALAAETGALTYAAFLAEERARLEPDPAAQLAGLKVAAEAYTAIGATGHARRLHAELVDPDFGAS